MADTYPMSKVTASKQKSKITLSKSKIKDMVNCERMLFNDLNIPNEKVWDKSTLGTFDQGRAVEQIARNMFPNAVLQDKLKNEDKVSFTKKLLKTNKVILEAAFCTKGTIVQFDVLEKNDDETYNAVEVKSSSKFKPEYETDVLIQYWVATHAGIKIKKFELWFVNKAATSTEKDYFTKHDVTEFVQANEKKFWELLNRAEQIAMLKNPPDVKLGAHCDRLDCAFRNSSNCKLTLKPGSVLTLPRFANAWESHHKGIETVHDPLFDETYKYTSVNPLVIESIRENKLVVDRENLLKDFSTWKFPLNFFDFETLMTAIPILDKQRPFEQVTFQFSNHLFDGVNKKLPHSLFLHKDKSSPDEKIVDAILSDLEKNDGSIVAYNKSFEQTRIRDLASRFPEKKDRLLAIVDRFVDLMDLVKDHVYHPAFNGSYSLKSVSPALLGEYGSYSDSLIKSGAEIATYFVEMVNTKDEERKELIRLALEKYCFYDTLNLFLVLQFLIDPNANIKELVELNLEIK